MRLLNLALFGLLACVATTSRATDRRNAVLIVCDDLNDYVTAVDDCIDQVADAIDNSPLAVRDNTICIVTSDRGWNRGQKDYLFKNSPWEESTRVPFIIRSPGVAKAGSGC